MEKRLIIDWISITSHKTYDYVGSASHPCINNFDDWEITTGKNGYNEGVKHKTGVSTYRNLKRMDMGKHTIYSGKALQNILLKYLVKPDDILSWHAGRGDNFARVDIAIDFIASDLTVQNFVDAYEKNEHVTTLKSASEIRTISGEGHTLYIGSTRKRKKLMRIYDKRSETKTIIPWIRAEIQIMGKPATRLVNMMIAGSSIESVMLGAIADVCDFPTIPLWSDAMKDKSNISIGASNDKLSNTREWLDKVVFNSILNEGINDKAWFDEYITSLLVEIKR